MSVVGAALALVCLPSKEARAQCVDEELKQDLVGGRHYRGVQERLFQKAFRHELSVMGGLYAADLYSSSWTLGGAYTFHFSEDLGLEASLARFFADLPGALGASSRPSAPPSGGARGGSDGGARIPLCALQLDRVASEYGVNR